MSPAGTPRSRATVMNDGERDEVPVQRDVDDVDVVLRRHAAGEPARDAVQLHDDADARRARRVQITSIQTIAA